MLIIWLQSRPYREITLYTGPAGGAGQQLGNKLAQKVPKPDFWEFYRERLELVVKDSQGFEDNRQQIDRDQSGSAIALAHDGFGPAGNVKILLPLDESYVHIIVSQTLWDAAQEFNSQQMTEDTDVEPREDWPIGVFGTLFTRSIKEREPRTFGQIADLLRELPYEVDGVGANDQGETIPRFSAFLGPKLSGTRQTAEMILRHYSVPINEIDAAVNYDWEHMMQALFRGEIHLAFMTTSPGSHIIEQIAHRGGFYLLGLDDVSGIRTLNSHISSASFGRFAYGIADDQENAFCNTELETIATRRVIICSKSMSESDGYYLATQLKAALRDEVPQIQWARQLSAEQRSSPQGYTFPFHPGSEPLRANYEPWYARIPGPFWPSIIVFTLSLLIATVNKIRKTLSNKHKGEDDDRRVHELQSTVDALAARDAEMSQSEFEAWKAKIAGLQSEVSQYVNRQGISDETREQLQQGIKELNRELELQKPVSKAKKKNKTKNASTKA